MTSIFHDEVIGGERFFEILDQMQQDLGHHEPVVELMYLCMSLGFVGRYRVMPRGVAELTELATVSIARSVSGEAISSGSCQRDGAALQPACGRLRGVFHYGRSASARSRSRPDVRRFHLYVGKRFRTAFAELFALPPHGQTAIPHQMPVVAAHPPSAPDPRAGAGCRR